MAESIQAGEGVCTAAILSEGNPLPDCYQLISLSVECSVNKVPTATLELMDGNMSSGEFSQTDANELEPGSKIEIELGYGEKTTRVFQGFVTRQNIRASGDNESRMSVECKDACVRMTVGRKNRNFVGKSDTQIIQAILENYSSLTLDKVGTTNNPNLELVQYYCTDWDFLLMRAAANGFVVIARDGKLTVDKPVSGTAGYKVAYGDDVIDFDIESDASTQLAAVKSRSWNPQTQEVEEVEVAPVEIGEQGNLEASQLAEVIQLDAYELQSPVPMDQADLEAWALGRQTQAAMSRITGTIKIVGTANVTVGSTLDIEDIGKRFSGKTYVSGVVHALEDALWTTEIQMGTDASVINDQNSVSGPAAGGMSAGIKGLQIGRVLALAGDPSDQARIQVELPVSCAAEPGIWARLAGFYASSNGKGDPDAEFGALFLPEVGDEVILGFLDGNPASAIVLGSLYSAGRRPPADYSDENNIKALITRNQLKIQFDEEQKSITISTPAENIVTIDDANKSITLQDETGNKVEMTPDGIALTSPKDFSIKADGKVEVTAGGNISLSSDGDASVDAQNIKQSAQQGLSASGNSQAELTSSGQTTVKGSMVMIN